jgi:hypothetical protein
VLLTLGPWSPLQFLHWLQFLGLAAAGLFGYCVLARA